MQATCRQAVVISNLSSDPWLYGTSIILLVGKCISCLLSVPYAHILLYQPASFPNFYALPSAISYLETLKAFFK